MIIQISAIKKHLIAPFVSIRLRSPNMHLFLSTIKDILDSSLENQEKCGSARLSISEIHQKQTEIQKDHRRDSAILSA
jgi:hypothetical protein